jgi:pimeloyl-ACP methyl ester carboxylesterase
MTTVTASDGVTLAVHAYTDIDRRRPTILAIHGYPDNHHVWDAVAEQLAEKCWTAITDPALMPKIGSYTSISGPHLDYAGKFLRSARSPRGVVDVAKQVLASTYIWLFLTPGLPEAIFRSGLGGKVVDAFDRIGRSRTRAQQRTVPRSAGGYRNGLNLYRANMPAPFFSRTAPLPQTSVAVQVLVPRKDIFVTPALQRFTGAIPSNSRVVPIEGGHWVVTSRPDVIAALTAEWVDRAVAGAPARGASVVRTGRRDVRGKLALVTGAGAGIGRATAVELARQGARTVIVVDRDLAAANETADAVRRRARWPRCNRSTSPTKPPSTTLPHKSNSSTLWSTSW